MGYSWALLDIHFELLEIKRQGQGQAKPLQVTREAHVYRTTAVWLRGVPDTEGEGGRCSSAGPVGTNARVLLQFPQGLNLSSTQF